MLIESPYVDKIVAGTADRYQSIRGKQPGSLQVVRPIPHGLELKGIDAQGFLRLYVYTKFPEEVANEIVNIKAAVHLYFASTKRDLRNR